MANQLGVEKASVSGLGLLRPGLKDGREEFEMSSQPEAEA